MKTEVRVLDNGLKVAAFPAPHLQTTCLLVGVNYGTVDEDPKLNGSAHYMEHMLFKGTKNRTWREISELRKNICVNSNALTDYESTIYLMHCHKKYFENAAELLEDMVANSLITKKDFDAERGPILNELHMYDDIPRSMLLERMQQTLYKNSPAGMRVVGTETSVKNICQEDLIELYEKCYSPENMCVIFYGGMQGKNAYKTIERLFGGIDKKYQPIKRKLRYEKQKRTEVVIRKKGIKQARLLVGFKCEGLRSGGLTEYLSMGLASSLLWREIFNEVRAERSLSYDILASYKAYGSFGTFEGGFGTDPVKVSEAKETLLKVFAGLREVKKEKFEEIKKSASVSYLALRDDPWNMAQMMSFAELTLDDAKIAENLPDLTLKVSLEDFRKYCDRYIDVENYSMLLLMPEGDGQGSKQL